MKPMEVLGPLSPVIAVAKPTQRLMREIYSCNPEMRPPSDEMLIVSFELENKSVVVYFVSDHGSDERVSIRGGVSCAETQLRHLTI